MLAMSTLLLACTPYWLCCLAGCVHALLALPAVFSAGRCADSLAVYVLLDVLHHQLFLLAPLHRWFIRVCVEAGWFTVIPLS